MSNAHLDPDRGEGGLYVHIPFCLRKCGYCDFYSLPLDPELVETTVSALLDELNRHLDRLPFALRTVFVGGGTPTVLPEPALARLFTRLGQIARSADIREFTVEANPDTFSPAKAAVLRQCGVNRISMGAQSFIPQELQTLERVHDPQTVRERVQQAGAAGFAHLSLDLIFGIPGQTRDSWRQSLETALSLPLDHLSCYGLTFEPGTRLSAGKDAGRIAPMAESLETELFTWTGPFLAEAGFPRYEISNFARQGVPEACCRHNLIYWNNQPYLGIGPAAASFVDGERRRNLPDLAAYLHATRERRSVVESSEIRDRAGFAHDLAMLRLRLAEGLDVADFQRRCGLAPRDFFADAIRTHTRAGLLEDTGTHLRLTPRGLLLANVVTVDFV